MAVDIGIRVTPYGVTTAQLQPMLTNLTVAAGQQVRLTRADANVSAHVKQLAPKNVAALKQIMSVPAPAATAAPVVGPVAKTPAVFSSVLSPQLTAVEHVSLWSSAHNAILGSTASVSASQIATVNQWLIAINPAIYVFFYQDITVEANATLVLARDVNVLFANNILIQLGGRIICQGARIKFDCASLTGFDGPPSPGTATGPA